MTAFCKVRSKLQRVPLTRRTITRWTILGVLLVLAVSCSLSVPSDERDIRDKMFDAYGGRERLAQIQSIAAEGTIIAAAGEDRGVYRRALRMDGKLFVDIKYGRSRETRILNGNRALRGVDGKIEEVSGPGYLAMIYQYNELSMPFGLLDGSFDVRDGGSESMDNIVVHVLHCTDRAGNSIDVFVDEATYRIVKTLGTFKVGDKSTILSAVFSDFRFFDGVLMPFRIVNFAGDTRTSETIIDNYLFNARLSDTLFDPHAHIQDQLKH